MLSDQEVRTPRLSFVEQLRPFVADEDSFGRISGDLQDVLAASAWLLKTVAQHENRRLSPAELEQLVADLDTRFVEHMFYHLMSLREDLKVTLERFPVRREDRAANLQAFQLG